MVLLGGVLERKQAGREESLGIRLPLGWAERAFGEPE